MYTHSHYHISVDVKANCYVTIYFAFAYSIGQLNIAEREEREAGQYEEEEQPIGNNEEDDGGHIESV